MGAKNHEKKLQLTFKKTKLKPGKLPDVEKQEAFVEWYAQMLEMAIKGEFHLLFYDPVHQLHNTINGKCWQEKGEKGTLVLPSNTGRRRISILGAINPLTYKFTCLTLEGMVDKEVTKLCLDNIRQAYVDQKEIVVIMDNAKYNRAYQVQEHAEKLNISIKYLPPYCPNLNLIERVWKFLKNKLKNQYIEKYADFKEWIFNFCKNFDDHKTDVARIISNKLQIIKAA